MCKCVPFWVERRSTRVPWRGTKSQICLFIASIIGYPFTRCNSYPGQGSAVRPRVSQRQFFPYNVYLSLYICVSPPKKFDLEVTTDRGEAYTHKPAQAKVGAVSVEPTSRPSRVPVATHLSRAEGPYDKMPRDHLQRQSRSKPHDAAGSGPFSGPRASCKSMQR